MYFYINDCETYIEYIAASKQLDLTEITEEEYLAALAALEEAE